MILRLAKNLKIGDHVDTMGTITKIRFSIDRVEFEVPGYDRKIDIRRINLLPDDLVVISFAI